PGRAGARAPRGTASRGARRAFAPLRGAGPRGRTSPRPSCRRGGRGANTAASTHGRSSPRRGTVLRGPAARRCAGPVRDRLWPAARGGDELVDLMLADALVLATRLAPGARVVDVGTGAGAPGLAIALARPDLVVTLCEPLAKRVSFLRTVLGTVGRTDVTLVAKRGEELAADAWDVAMARATLAPPSWLE